MRWIRNGALAARSLVRLGFRFTDRQPAELREELGKLATQIAAAAAGT